MSEKPVRYECECGERWSITPSGPGPNATRKCECGRTIIVQDRFVYGTMRPPKTRLGVQSR